VSNKIPKVIHYCWFGGNPLPESVRKCIESWKTHCPDFEVVEWNEKNFDVNINKFVREAYQLEKWAFVSDYARLYIIYHNGGIYLDTDVEVVKGLDDLLDNEAFMGFEDGINVSNGLGFGAVKNSKIIYEMLNIYENISFINNDGTLNTTPCPYYTTQLLLKKNLKQNNKKQTIEGLTIYPSDYFSPINYATRKFKMTKNTYSIHHYSATWWDEEAKEVFNSGLKWRRIFGIKIGNLIYGVLDKGIWFYFKKVIAKVIRL
jgi:mannosyltransferase OCH1-like enzyme